MGESGRIDWLLVAGSLVVGLEVILLLPDVDACVVVVVVVVVAGGVVVVCWRLLTTGNCVVVVNWLAYLCALLLLPPSGGLIGMRLRPPETARPWLMGSAGENELGAEVATLVSAKILAELLGGAPATALGLLFEPRPDAIETASGGSPVVVVVVELEKPLAAGGELLDPTPRGHSVMGVLEPLTLSVLEPPSASTPRSGLWLVGWLLLLVDTRITSFAGCDWGNCGRWLGRRAGARRRACCSRAVGCIETEGDCVELGAACDLMNGATLLLGFWVETWIKGAGCLWGLGARRVIWEFGSKKTCSRLDVDSTASGRLTGEKPPAWELGCSKKLLLLFWALLLIGLICLLFDTWLFDSWWRFICCCCWFELAAAGTKSGGGVGLPEAGCCLSSPPACSCSLAGRKTCLMNGSSVGPRWFWFWFWACCCAGTRRANWAWLLLCWLLLNCWLPVEEPVAWFAKLASELRSNALRVDASRWLDCCWCWFSGVSWIGLTGNWGGGSGGMGSKLGFGLWSMATLDGALTRWKRFCKSLDCPINDELDLIGWLLLLFEFVCCWFKLLTLCCCCNKGCCARVSCCGLALESGGCAGPSWPWRLENERSWFVCSWLFDVVGWLSLPMSGRKSGLLGVAASEKRAPFPSLVGWPKLPPMFLLLLINWLTELTLALALELAASDACCGWMDGVAWLTKPRLKPPFVGCATKEPDWVPSLLLPLTSCCLEEDESAPSLEPKESIE